MKVNYYKKCKGTGRAKSFGCGEIKFIHRYSLCCKCFYEFLYNSEEGESLLSKTMIKAKKIASKPKKRKYIKWVDKPLSEMVKYVQFEIVNPYIRLRDKTKFNRCISSNNGIVDAGHYYPTTFNKLRFCCQNIHGQNDSDNRFKSANLASYKEGLIDRFGQKYFDELEKLKADSNSWPKMDRIELIRIGKTYEHLTKKRIWCFRHEEFDNYKDLTNN